MAATHHPSICFKRGDDFKLDFTVTDKNNTTSLALLATVVEAQATLDAALAADPLVQQDVDDAQTALDNAQAAYDTSIIVDITGWTMVSQVRRSGKTLIDALDVTILDAAAGTFALTKDSVDTQLWPVLELGCDIQFTRPTGIISSETFIIKVEKDMTY